MVIPFSRNKAFVIATKHYTKAVIKVLFRSRFACCSYSVPNILSRIEGPLFLRLQPVYKNVSNIATIIVHLMSFFNWKQFFEFQRCDQTQVKLHFVNKLVSACCNLAYCSQTSFDALILLSMWTSLF